MHAAVHEACSLLTLAWLQDFKIQNVVGSADVKFPVRLEGLSFAHSLFCSVSTSPRPDSSLCCVTSLGSWPARTSWQLQLNLPDSTITLSPSCGFLHSSNAWSRSISMALLCSA